MTDMLIPNRPQKGKNIDEILAGLPKEEQPDTKPKAPAEEAKAASSFTIESNPDFYRLPWVDFLKRVCPREIWSAYYWPAQARTTLFSIASAPIVYKICKELYENRDNADFNRIVRNARGDLSLLLNQQIYALSTIYRTGTIPIQDIVSHGIEISTHSISGSGDYTGPSGLIVNIATRAEKFVQDVLATQQSMKEVNDVFKWITNTDTRISRLNSQTHTTGEYVILMGIDKTGPSAVHDMCIASSGNKECRRSALMVRYRGTK